MSSLCPRHKVVLTPGPSGGLSVWLPLSIATLTPLRAIEPRVMSPNRSSSSLPLSLLSPAWLSGKLDAYKGEYRPDLGNPRRSPAPLSSITTGFSASGQICVYSLPRGELGLTTSTIARSSVIVIPTFDRLLGATTFREQVDRAPTHRLSVSPGAGAGAENCAGPDRVWRSPGPAFIATFERLADWLTTLLRTQYSSG